uniref:Rab proteins geranylgeranyltransferase component A n=1 Tax=Schistocephalus solidus TaxID=70667 RepID=A0A0X3Q2N5_SCHSO
MELPTEFDYIIVGTGLIESIIAASLSITGNSVLHIDSENYYGGLMASFRFPDLLNKMTEWAREESSAQTSCADLSNLAQSCRSIFRHCSSSFYIDVECPESFNEGKPCNEMDEAPTFTDVLSPSEITSGGEQSTSQNDQPALDPRPSSRLASPTTGTAKETSPAPVASAGRIQPSDTAPSENSYRENPSHSLITHPPRQWSQATLKRQLHRLDLDIMPKLIYADSPMVTAMLRTDVTRYLEFRPVSRLLTFARQASRLQDSTPQASSSSSDTNTLPAFRSLIKMPISRGEVFRTRILGLTQKRHLVGFLEWCASLSPQDIANLSSSTPEAMSNLQPNDIAFLDRPLVEYLQNQRGFDSFTSQLTVTCLSLSSAGITLRDALPKFRRLLSSMNRVGPYPLLWPLFGCADIPQAFCRMSAVFSCVYCLHRTVENVIRLPDPGFSSTPAADSSTTRPRRLCIKLSSGEEIKTSGFLVSALNSPTAWVLPQVHRWLARAILISSSSIYPQEFKPHDISLLPLTLPYPPNENSDELAFLLEIPVEERNTNLFVAHMWIACQELKDPRNLFGPIIDILYRKA